MSQERKGLYRFGGAALMVSGLLFLLRDLLDRVAGPPPSSGVAILAWIASGQLVLALANEVLFFAAMALVPAVIALYRSLVDSDRVAATTGCGIIAAVVPILAVLDIVHGRLVYPVYGIRVSTPAVAELVVAIFYGGLHAVGILMGVATFVLSLAMRRGAYGRSIAWLGFATAVCDIIGAYPYAIGPLLTLVCQLFFAAWFVAVGAKLYAMRSPIASYSSS